ncbi:hypothetical protein [Halarchaeum salinum]|uniref:Uncharacterized protein n=1 Tax=Halarchaeum salinum TaxID=489912 RepID=A0AAV3S8S8_9EURY
MRKEMLAVGLALTLVATAFGASAFTSASVDVNSNMQVAADENALIGLQDQSSGDIVDTTGNRLVINTSTGTAEGLNQNSTVEIGNYDNIQNGFAENDSAFSITNNAGEERDFTLSYTGYSETNGVENVNFTVVDKGTGIVDSANETNDATVNSVGTNSTRYVLVRINTTGISSTGDLNGTLKVEATPSSP